MTTTENPPEPEAKAPAEPVARPKAQGFTWMHALSLFLAVAITAVIIIFRRQLAAFSTYGYLGIFVVTLVGNATILLPVPGLVAVFAGGTAFNPLTVGLVAGVAQSLGEITGYLAGYGGQAVIENRRWYERFSHWMEKHGFLTVLVLALIPNPLFDVAGIAAGALRMPLWQFLLACLIGKTIKTIVVAYLGLLSVGWLAPLLRSWGL
jgi:membrane protein YqaA with SNARE-associated domain